MQTRGNALHSQSGDGGGGGGGMVLVRLPLVAPIGLLPLYVPTPCGPEWVLVVSTEPLDDLSCLTTPGVGYPRDGLLPVPLTRCIQMHTPSPCWVCLWREGGGQGLGGWLCWPVAAPIGLSPLNLLL